MDNFKTSGIYSKKLFFLSSLSTMRFYHLLLSIFCLLYGIYLFFLAASFAYPFYTALGFVSLFLAAAPLIKSWLNSRLSLKRLAELGGNNRATTFFEDDGFHCIGVTGNENTLPYSAIRIACIRRDYIFIISKANMHAAVFRSELSPERQKALIEYLRQRNIRIRGKLR